jgi:hypothetical protein
MITKLFSSSGAATLSSENTNEKGKNELKKNC